MKFKQSKDKVLLEGTVEVEEIELRVKEWKKAKNPNENDIPVFEDVKVLRTCIMPEEHVTELNLQKENSLMRYEIIRTAEESVTPKGIDDMTKPELIVYATEHEIKYDPKANKETLLETIKEAEAEKGGN